MDRSVGKKLHDYFYNLGRKSYKPINNTLTEAGKIAGHFKDTVKDIPAIAKTQALTSGPQTLDAINDYLYKPVTRNVKAFVTGKDDHSDNFIDKVADDARAYEDNFYKTHDFHQKMNQKHGKKLGNVLEAGATLGLGAGKNTLKGGKAAVPAVKTVAKKVTTQVDDVVKGKPAVKSLTDKAKETIPKLLNKDKKIKNKQAVIDKLKKSFEKSKPNLTDGEQAKVVQHIKGLEDEVRLMKENTGIKLWNEIRKQAKVDKTIQKIAKPDGKIKSAAKWVGKYGALAAGIGGAGFIGHQLLTKDETTKTDNSDIEAKYTVPNQFSDKNKENQQFDTGKENNFSTKGEGNKREETSQAASSASQSNGTTSKSTSSNTTSAKNSEGSSNASKSSISSSQEVAKIYTKNGQPRSVFLIDGKLKAQKKDGSYETLIDGVTPDNLRHKFTMVANTPFND